MVNQNRAGTRSRPYRFGRSKVIAVAWVLLSALCAGHPAHAVTDAAIIDGFQKTVFGSEYARRQTAYVRKFVGPVRFYVRSRVGRAPVARVHQFISQLDGLISNLNPRLMPSVRFANFTVHLVNRAQYKDTVRRIVLRNPNAPVRGRCMVRSIFSRMGITRSDAVVVVDEGAALFERCMHEEILQGLGPLNDDPSLADSMFNDRSRHTEFRRFDRLILNVLYDPRIRVGASPQEVARVLPRVVRDVRRRIEGR
ncbi:MAG: DUF2927 domain-containing protein [Pseudomonadota bacterium]